MSQSETVAMGGDPANPPIPVAPAASNASAMALTPSQVDDALEASAAAKTNTPAGRIFVSAMLAGAFIGFGALFFLVATSDATLSFAGQKIIGGLCFCLGLILVLCCGAELFTGNALMVEAGACRRIAWRAMLKNWLIVWVGNLVGALIAVALVAAAGIMDLNDSAVGATAISVAAAKIAPGWWTLFFRGILCNIFVCLAVRIGTAARSVTDKVIGILIPISGFVACGFEHCVANMFFLPLGFVSSVLGYAVPEGVAGISATGILANLSAATLGNIVGGVVFVGLAYYFIDGRHRIGEPA